MEAFFVTSANFFLVEYSDRPGSPGKNRCMADGVRRRGERSARAVPGGTGESEGGPSGIGTSACVDSLPTSASAAVGVDADFAGKGFIALEQMGCPSTRYAR